MKKANTTIDKAAVEHIARLSRLGLKESEITKLQTELSAIVGYVTELESVATDAVEATSQVTGLENAFEADQPRPCLSQEEALSQSPQKANGYFKVKAIL